MRRAVGVAFERDRGHRDHRPRGELLLELGVLGFAVGEPEPPAVVVDHDRDVVGVVEGRCAALEGGVVEVPLRGGGPPDELRELAPVLLVPRPAALGGEVVLVPPLELGLRRQGQPAGLLAADQVAADRDQPAAALRPERRDDVGGSRSPVEPGHDRALDARGRPAGRSRRRASAACSPLRNVSSDRKRVVPKPRRYGTITR